MKRTIQILHGCLLISPLMANESSLQEVVMDESGNYISLRHFKQESHDRSTYKINKRYPDGSFQWQVALEAHVAIEIKTLHSGAEGFTVIVGNFQGNLFM